MPIYEYRCEHCGYQFEILQRLGESGADVKCPACDNDKVKKAFSAFATSGEGRAVSGSKSCGHGGFS